METVTAPIAAPALRQPVSAVERTSGAKVAHSARRVDSEAFGVLVEAAAPRPGDLVLARVDRLGQHGGLQLASGRRATLFPGDEIVVAYGNRYAPDQFEAETPPDLSPCHLVASGGIAARALCHHDAMRSPTEITPVGLVGDAEGRPINLADWALGSPVPVQRRPLTVAVVGTSMNAGKTTAAASLVRGLVASGATVGAGKVTGTAAGNDLWLLADAGARPVFDFTDAGFATTYRASVEEVEGIFATITGHLAAAAVDAIVLEIADGLFQRETEALVGSPQFAAGVDAVLFAADGALAAAAGTEWLSFRRLRVLGVSGALTRSPLAVREAELATGLPVYTAAMLRDPLHAGHLAATAEAPR